MKCPQCDHTPLPGESTDPTRCPSCGVFYHKSLANVLRETIAEKAALAESAAEAARSLVEKDEYIEKLKASGAKVMGYEVKEAIVDYPGATPVVVLDARMSFMSMVWFMVKWTFASIPALVIVIVLLVFIASLFGGVGNIIRHI